MSDKTEKEKMLAGELYRAADVALVAERRRAQHMLARYNAMPDDSQELRTLLLREFLSGIGEGAVIQPIFMCDYGYNIRLGRNVIINYHCVFLDCARSRSAMMCRSVRPFSSIPRNTRSIRLAGARSGVCEPDPYRQERVDRRRRDHTSRSDDRRQQRDRRRQRRVP